MTQGIVLKKLHAIFSTTNPELAATLVQRTKSPDNKEVESVQGHCSGFSKTHAAMCATGFRKWWHHSLVAIATSGNDIEKPILIPGSRNSVPTELIKPTTVKALAVRALNYIVPSQVTRKVDGDSYCDTQEEILDPTKKLFAVVDER